MGSPAGAAEDGYRPEPRLVLLRPPSTGPCSRCGANPVADHKRVRAVDLSGKAYRGALLLGQAFLELVAETYEAGLQAQAVATQQARLHYPPSPGPLGVEVVTLPAPRRFP